MVKEIRPRISPEEYEIIKNQRLGVNVTSKTTPNDYKEKPSFVLSAWSDQGKMMEIDEYCQHYNLPRQDISSYKLVSHTGTPFYNIVFKEQTETSGIDLEAIRAVLNREIKRTYTYTPKPSATQKERVLKWADLHFGAHIRNLLLSPDYDSNILLNGLLRSVEEVNELGSKETHVHIHGDLIESLSGLNHINSWMSMDKDEAGANSIILCTELLDKALSKINNLGKIKIVAGNHDRLSKDNAEDVKGGAAELIAWGLRLKGFDVEFHPYVITHLVGKINYIILHGDKVISKRSTADIIWKYGIKGVYNLICEAHLHSLIEKMSASQRDKHQIIKDDSIDHRRMTLQPFFTGNYYSETLGFLTNAGYSIFWDNGNGKPSNLTVTI